MQHKKHGMKKEDLFSACPLRICTLNNCSSTTPFQFSNPLQQTGPEYEEVIELSENMAYKPVQSIKLRANEAYQHVQQWFIGTA